MSQENDAHAAYRVLRARVELTMARRFYGVLIQHVEPVLSRAHPTMATDGKRHYFNPDFIHTLSQVELLAVQAHESEHDARHHGTRRNGRDPIKWNIACDYAINIDLKDQGFALPKGALIDEKYRGMSAEDIYRARELDEQKQQQAQDEPQDEPQDEQQDENEEGESENEEGDKADEQMGDDNEPDNGDTSQDEPKADSESNKEGSEDSEAAAPTDSGTSEGGNGSATAQGEGEGEEKENSDPGMMGEVLDSVSEEGAELSDLDIKWERIVRQAATLSKGDTPGHITREIERANNPTRNWRDELREFCEQGALRIETWNRPNRRHAHRGQILPSMQKDGIGKAALVVDTSGSMDNVALASVRNEMQGMLDDGVIEEMVVIFGDTRVTRIDHFQTGDELDFDPRGGGGTDLKPHFQYVAEQVEDASVLIAFTDLDIGDAGPEPHCPVLFAVTGYPDTVRNRIANAPWGARGIDVGAR